MTTEWQDDWDGACLFEADDCDFDPMMAMLLFGPVVAERGEQDGVLEEPDDE